ncbi:MAG: hypothetical protein C0473_00440 [Cyanobacteria bacterium DS3.002]|nr:hypothetical protein [Cyanobacteria bacterium DS3.002]MBA4050097.1 hypothetical protein [Cyanobacteria bacterium DS2.008]
MGRKSFFTEAEIFEAADTLAAQGHEVTAQTLFKVMGGGSYTTVYKHLEAWRESRPALVNPVVAMDLPEPVQTAFVAAWRVAASEAAREVSAIRDKAAEDVKAANKQLHEALEQMGRLEAEAEADTNEIEGLKERNGELEAIAKKAETENAALAAKAEQLEYQVAYLAEVEAAKDTAIKQAAQLSGQLEQLNKQSADLLSLLAQRDKQK